MTYMNENDFRQIKDHPCYFVNRKGVVGSIKWGYFKILKPFLSVANPKSYYRHIFTHHCKQSNVGVSRLVAGAFIPNPENKAEVNHKDGDTLNNHVDNLEWVTPKENIHHARDVLRRKFGNYKGLPVESYAEVHRRLDQGQSQEEVALHFGVSQATISRVHLKRRR